MLLGANDDVQIASRSTTMSGVAFARNADSLPVARSRFDTHFQRLSHADHAFATAVWTLILYLASAMTPRTRHVEFHAPASLAHLARAFTVGTSLSRTDCRLAFADGANVLAGDIQSHNGSADGLPKSNCHLIFQICSRFGTLWLWTCAAAGEDAGEDVAKSTTAAGTLSATAGEVGKVKATKIEWNSLPSRASATRVRASSSPAAGASIGFGGCRIDVVGVEANLIVNFPLLRIAEDVVGLRELLEPFLSLLISRIDVRMVF